MTAHHGTYFGLAVRYVQAAAPKPAKQDIAKHHKRRSSLAAMANVVSSWFESCAVVP